MSFSDPLGDMLTRIRNGQQARKSDIKVPASKLRENVLEVLKREGYIRGYERVSLRKGIDEGRPVISEIVRVSTPGRRVYSGVKELQKFYNGLGISVLSTPQGVMSDHEARQANVGGEILCKVF